MRHRIGLIADVQYADIDDVWNFTKTHKRKYRSTLTCLRNAVELWSSLPNLKLLLDLGDAIDGFKNTNREMGMHALQKVLVEWARLNPTLPICHLIGNHELYKFSREELIKGVESTGFNCAAPPSLLVRSDPLNSINYTFNLSQGSSWRIVILDPYAESVMRNGGGRVGLELTLDNGGLDPTYTQLCQQNNPNNILKATDYFAGLTGEVCRWSPFNGGLGKDQLVWLENTLRSACSQGEHVLIASHVIVHPKATPRENCHTLLWDYTEALDLIDRYDCVKLVVCGHAHHEGYHHCERSKVHHITVPSPLEAPDEVLEETFGYLELDEAGEKAELVGYGWVTSRTLDLR
jgi:manganese-dependent ADP-ribose/CDP-alcohol diphosphatase